MRASKRARAREQACAGEDIEGDTKKGGWERVREKGGERGNEREKCTRACSRIHVTSY